MQKLRNLCPPKNEEEVEACNKRSSKDCKAVCPKGEWGVWSLWSSCSSSCEGGWTSRYRKVAKEALNLKEVLAELI